MDEIHVIAARFNISPKSTMRLPFVAV